MAKQLANSLPFQQPEPLMLECQWVAAYCGKLAVGPSSDSGILSRYAQVTSGVLDSTTKPGTSMISVSPAQARRLQHLLAVRCGWNGLHKALLELECLRSTMTIGDSALQSILAADVLQQHVPKLSAESVDLVYRSVSRGLQNKSPVVARMLLTHMRRRGGTTAPAVKAVEDRVKRWGVKRDAALQRELILSWVSINDDTNACSAYQTGLDYGMFHPVSKSCQGRLWYLDLHKLPHPAARIALLHTMRTLEKLTSDNAPEWLVLGVGRGTHGNHAGQLEMRCRVLEWLGEHGIPPMRPETSELVRFPRRYNSMYNPGVVIVRNKYCSHEKNESNDGANT